MTKKFEQRKNWVIFFKSPEPGLVVLIAVEEPSPQCSYLVGTQPHIAHTMLPLLPAALSYRKLQCQPPILKEEFMRKREREKETFATPLGGYSPFSFGSTHCLTLSSLNLGVALKHK